MPVELSIYYWFQHLFDPSLEERKTKMILWEKLTLVYDNEVDWCAMVLVFLFGIPSKTNVFAAILKSDVPQQDRDVIPLIFSNKLHPFSIYGDIWHRILRLYRRITHLKAAWNCQGSEEVQSLRRKRGSFYHLDAAIAIKLPVKVKVFDANAAGVGAGQHHSAAVHCLQVVDLPYRHLKGMSRPQTWRGRSSDKRTKARHVLNVCCNIKPFDTWYWWY